MGAIAGEWRFCCRGHIVRLLVLRRNTCMRAIAARASRNKYTNSLAHSPRVVTNPSTAAWWSALSARRRRLRWLRRRIGRHAHNSGAAAVIERNPCTLGRRIHGGRGRAMFNGGRDSWPLAIDTRSDESHHVTSVRRTVVRREKRRRAEQRNRNEQLCGVQPVRTALTDADSRMRLRRRGGPTLFGDWRAHRTGTPRRCWPSSLWK